MQTRSAEITRRFGSTLVLVERPVGERVLLHISCPTLRNAQDLIHEFGGSMEKLQPDWLQQYARQARGKPLRIGSRLVILGERPQRAVHERTLVIPAEAAFGTGQHATTAMCLRFLEQTTRHFPPAWAMLDAGTGSGILAIAGRYFGASRVLAIDNDPLACATAKRNARANRAHNIEFSTGDILKRRITGKFDIIAANLFSEILIKTLPAFFRHLTPGGHLILSGVLRNQEAAVVRALRRNGFTMSEVRRRGKWIALLANRRKAQGTVPTSKRA